MKYLKFFENYEESLFTVTHKDSREYDEIVNKGRVSLSEEDLSVINSIVENITQELPKLRKNYKLNKISSSSDYLIIDLDNPNYGSFTRIKILKYEDDYFIIHHYDNAELSWLSYPIYLIDGWDGLEYLLKISLKNINSDLR